MKKVIFIFTLLIVVSCKKETQKTIEKAEVSDVIPQEEFEEAEEERVLDWEGSYVGILPCEDCEGRNTEINLTINHTYTKSTLYMKTDDDEVEERGSFLWLEDGCTIVLDDKEKTKLKVNLNKLTVLQSDGSKHKERAEEYVLQKNICESKDFEEFRYKGNDGKEYVLIFGYGCDGLFAEVKSDELSLLMPRETASEFTTTYGDENGFKLIDENVKATLYLEGKDVELTPIFDKH